MNRSTLSNARAFFVVMSSDAACVYRPKRYLPIRSLFRPWKRDMGNPIHKTASTLATATLVVSLMLSGTSLVWAQQKGPSLKEQLVGTWTFVSAKETRKDGTKVDRWGANPKGSLMFDANGRYMFIITRSDLPKFAANSATEGTAEEDKAVVKGMLVYFGTYSVSEADKTLVTHVEGSSFPNIIGTDQKRIITLLTADELKYHNPVSSIAGDAQVIWKRVK